MDYQYLRQTLMHQYQQLVIFDLKEVPETQYQNYLSRSDRLVYDLTPGQTLSRRYYMSHHNFKPLFVILDEQTLSQTSTAYSRYLTTIFNLYRAVVKKTSQMITYEQMEHDAQQVPMSDRQIHAIWFREKGFKLPNKIMVRVESWLQLNPDFQYHLWTNLIDEHELEEFISELIPSHKEYFLQGRIRVRYYHEILEQISDFAQKYPSFKDPQVFPKEPLSRYKFDRIFRTDMLRIIVLNLHGGIYCDFNDTICFYPMKYLLSLYRGEYFVGTDFSVDQSQLRNNYFMYNSFGNQQFLDLSVRCLNRSVVEYQRLTQISFVQQYVDLADHFLQHLCEKNQSYETQEPILVSLLLEEAQLKMIKTSDSLKTNARIIELIAEIFLYWGHLKSQCNVLGQRLKQELSYLDLNHLNGGVIKKKHMRSIRTKFLTIGASWAVEPSYVISSEFMDYFLLKYATIMTIGDLIMSTNFAYISDHDNLVPYSRLNRLSTISMITHLYEGTSYGLDKNYQCVDFSNESDLRYILL